MRFVLPVLAGLIGLCGLAAAADTTPAPPPGQPVKTPHVEASLVPETNGVKPGGTVSVALRLAIIPHWHTYWSYAGDSGEATEVNWTLPAGVTAGALQFPTPRRIDIGPVTDYGYEGTVLHLTDIAVPATAQAGQTIPIKADVTWLVCADVCVPEDATLSLSLPVTAGDPPVNGDAEAEFTTARAAMPKPANWPVSFYSDTKTVSFTLNAPDLADASLQLIPSEGGFIKNAAQQQVTNEGGKIVLTTEVGRRLQTQEKLAKVTAIPAVFVVTGSGGKVQAFTASAAPGPAPAPAASAAPSATVTGSDGDIGIGTALGFAFLGGLILNLMPCVFPVLSMKALALAKDGGDPAAARIGGIAYTVGIIVAFVALAGVLIALRSVGSQIGWGFQLQSPPVVAALALLFLAIGLNLMGVFEVGTSLQNTGSSLTRGEGVVPSFLTGVLAAVVAAPCTAPFMGAAVFTALVQPVPIALAIFAALGFGMAAPFLILAFWPALIRRLPRPGAWMERLKQVLAFPMFASAAWLAWVLSIAGGPNALALALGAGLLAAFALWLWGLVQRGEAGWIARGFAALAVIGTIAAVIVVPQTTGTAMAAGDEESGPKSEAYTPAKLAALLKDGKPVFVNLTAAWCVTCLVNEQVALSSTTLAEAFTQHQVAYLKGDWTNQDADISKLLERYGRAGVPLYLYYAPGKTEPQILPQILTTGTVMDAVQSTPAA